MSASRRLPHCGCIFYVNQNPLFLPLISVDAHTSILSSVSRTTLTQTFLNPKNDSPLREVRYMFPLYDGVSVVDFSCTFGAKVIRGVVKERHEAKKEFQDAVDRGEMAGLLQQSNEASDVFTTNLGNIPAGERVKVEITYLGELKHDAQVDGLRFTIPTSVAPRYGPQETYRPTPNIRLPKGSITFTVDAEMPDGSAIKNIESPSHPISVNIGTISKATKATPSLQRAHATLSQGSAELDKDFILQVVATGLGDPIAVLESHPDIPNQRALMTTLVPRFNLPIEHPEVVFVCDRSGSMGQGNKIPNLIAALQIFLKSLPVGVKFNICSFGSRFSFLWEKSRTYDQETLDSAIKHVQEFSSNFGGTEMHQPIKEAFERRYKDMNLEVFLLTDGEIWGQETLFNLINDEVTKSNGAIRVFSLGVGEDVSHALIEGAAQAGNGFAQTVASNEKMDKKLIRMLKGALTPHINDYTLEIKYDKDGAPSSADGDDDDFELVEKVMDALVIDIDDKPEEGSAQPEDTNTTQQATISLFDSSLKNEDLDMPDANSTTATLQLPAITPPRYLQAPFKIPSLYSFNRTTVYVLLSDLAPNRPPKSVILKATSKHGPLSLEIPITMRVGKELTIHQLAARKAIRELEDGRGWVFHAKAKNGKLLKDQFEGRFSDLVKREGVRLGTTYQVGGRWCSFVAVLEKDQGSSNDGKKESETVGDFEVVPLGGGGGNHARRNSRVMRHGMVMPTFFAAKRSAPASASIPRMRAPVHDDSFTQYVQQTSNVSSASLTESMTPIDVSLERKAKRKGKSEHNEDSLPMPALPGSMEKHKRLDEGLAGGLGIADPLSTLVSLQGFAGNWQWSERLQNILAVTKEQVVATISSSGLYASNDDILATVCAVVYLKKKLVAQKDTWELFVDKAEGWLAQQVGDSIKDLQKEVEDKLFV